MESMEIGVNCVRVSRILGNNRRGGGEGRQKRGDRIVEGVVGGNERRKGGGGWGMGVSLETPAKRVEITVVW